MNRPSDWVAACTVPMSIPTVLFVGLCRMGSGAFVKERVRFVQLILTAV